MIAEVVAVSAVYIAVSITAVSSFDVTQFFPEYWPANARQTGSTFLIGATVQIALVLAGAYIVGLEDLKRAIYATFARSTQKAWSIAVIATAIHIATALFVILPEPERVWEPSTLNLILSAVPAADGWSQELLFRGYVLFRLARGGVPALPQILLSGLLFAMIHWGYVGDGVWAAVTPLIGTFMLGCFFAWAVQCGNESLKPVIFCHMLIIVVLQPWLAFAH